MKYDRQKLEDELRAKLKYYDAAKAIHASMLFAGDDGSWAGETDPVKVHLLATGKLAHELGKLIAAAYEDAAKIAEGVAPDEGLGSYYAVERSKSLQIASAIRAKAKEITG
jgi:hypothetical protein